jgi:DNA-binding transcriptional ArsR family regulator
MLGKNIRKIIFKSSDIVKKSNIYLGVSYYLGIMAASATLNLDKKGYVFVIGCDRMEFMDIEETQTVSCAEVFGSLGHPQRILIVKELLKGETTITKLAKKFKLTTKEVKEHLSELERSGIVNSEIESKIVHKLNCDREALRGKVQAAADILLSDE